MVGQPKKRCNGVGATTTHPVCAFAFPKDPWKDPKRVQEVCFRVPYTGREISKPDPLVGKVPRREAGTGLFHPNPRSPRSRRAAATLPLA
jgi:hypothetical protein